MKKSARVTAAVLFAVVLLLTVFSALLSAHHHHSGEDCRVCAFCAVLRAAKAILSAVLFSVAAVSSKAARRISFRPTFAPARMRVRLLN